MAFQGIPDDAFDFFEHLRADNTKSWWTAHRTTYDESVRAPLVALLDALEGEFGTGHVFRPYRDVRFSKNKDPYKDHAGAFVEVNDAVGYYLQLSADGLMVAGGWYAPQNPQLARYRDVVAGPGGAELERVVGEVAKEGFTLGGDVMKTKPRGHDADHPRIELLRHRSLVASREWQPAAWMGSTRALGRLRDSWRALTPLVTWLGNAVGPGDPESRRR